MSSAKQNRILVWRREVASALDDAASTASSSSTITTSSAAGASNPSGLPESPTSSFSSASSRRRALWSRLTRRFALQSGPDSAAANAADSPRTAMYRDTPLDAALEGLTVVDSAPDAPAPAAQPSPLPEPEAQEEEQPLGAASSSDGGGRGLRERQERLQRAARLLQHGPKNEDRALAVPVRT
jgi:hypothetical protein